MKILLIEDDPASVTLLTKSLRSQHHIVDAVKDGEMGWTYASTFDYNLIILDVMLPKLDGISLCTKLRSEGYTMPILLLTAQDQPAAKVQGLEAGADDYVVKPFDIAELIARVRALLRRGSTNSLFLLSWGDLVLNPSNCDVTYNGQLLTLTTKEYDLLELLLRDSSHVFSSDEIIDRLWSSNDFPAEATVRSHLRRLRHKLQAVGAPADMIGTIHGRGYYLKAPPSPEQNDRLIASVEIDHPQIDPINSEDQTSSENQQSDRSALLLIDLDPALDSALTSLAQQQDCLAVTLFSAESAMNVDKELDVQKGHGQMVESYLANISSDTIFLPTVVVISLKTDGKKIQEEYLVLIHHIHQMFPHWSVLALSKSAELQVRLAVVQNGGKFLAIEQLTPAQIFCAATALCRSVVEPIKVMVVDDDVNWLRAVPQLLQPWEMKVTTLDDPLRFWQILQSVQPDVLILDIRMPEISGLELCQILRGDPLWQHLPVLVLTAAHDASTQQQVFLAGADDYLCKPMPIHELAQRILHRWARSQPEQYRALR